MLLYKDELCPRCKLRLKLRLLYDAGVLPQKEYYCDCGYSIKPVPYEPKPIPQRVEEMLGECASAESGSRQGP